MTIDPKPIACENAYAYKGKQADCHNLYNCCDCGGNECGCPSCFSCKACEFCLNEE